MKITKDTVVTMQVKVADSLGRLIEAGKEPVAYLHGGYGNTLPKIEEALEGREAGFAVTLDLKADAAFGQREDRLLASMPKRDFPPGVKVGGQIEGHTEDGESVVFNVVKIKGDTVHLDANHPLAGKDLRFVLKVTGVRAASPEEIAHKHAHGAHGAHH
jgi:FKBP-type peptidyl-prolyl cis-trans isomerase SlyD